jgi:hypothetical protein
MMPEPALATAPRPAAGRATAKLTFAIPYYSGLGYLEKAVASVFAQTRPGWRLLVCDDGNDPEAEALVRARRDDRVAYHRNERNLGMAANWNRCLDLAATDLVTLLHADDELLPGYADTMLDVAGRNPDAVAFFCAAHVIDEHGRACFSFPDAFKRLLVPSARGAFILKGEPALQALLRGNFIMCPTLCYRKSRLAPRRFDPGWKMAQDLRLTAGLLLDGETLVGDPRVAYAYRRHAHNATVQYTDSLLRFQEEARLYDELAREARRRGWVRAARVAERKGIIKLHLAYRLLQDLGRGRLRRAGEKLALLGRLLGRGGAAAS